VSAPTNKPIQPWSYSALNTFENCPRKFWATKIAKIVSDVNNANYVGDVEHQAIQHYLQKGLMLPPEVVSFKPLLDKIKAAPGQQYVEYAMCLKQDMTPTRFKDWNEGWVRGATDYLKVNGAKAYYFDWKSGKYRVSEDQIELMALMIFRHFPEVQQVNAGLVFYKAGRVHPHIVYKTDEPTLWNGFISRVRDLEQAKLTDNWPATPNPLCGWCPYKACPHNTTDERLAREAAKGKQ
jgi:hypothetical protein